MIFLGDIPPPLHGMSAINKKMLDRLRTLAPVTFINSSPSLLARFYHSRFWFFIKFAFFFPVTLRLLWALTVKRERVLYRSLNGGSGQVFDFFWVGFARLFGAQIFLHHHAALYLTCPSILFNLVCKTAGAKARHIVLGEAMRLALKENYKVPDEKISVLSNAAFFSNYKAIESPNFKKQSLKIGYLANISFSKGIDVVLKTLTQLKQIGVPFEAVIAGPCHDPELKTLLDQACFEFPELHYLGGLYGDDKARFFADLDCFIYPSRNEAEPLVIYEAAVEGVYILSSEAGCMKASTQRLDGWSMPLTSVETWANVAASHIKNFETFTCNASRQSRKNIFQAFISEAHTDLDSLIKEITYAKA